MYSLLPEWCTAEKLILGCGNILLGDDGFGPSVIRYLKEHYNIPQGISLIDAGTSVREILFDILISERHPEEIVIIDSLDFKKVENEIYEIDAEELPRHKSETYEFHLAPTVNLFLDIKRRHNVKFRIFVCQIKKNYDIKIGISSNLELSVKKMADIINKDYFNMPSENKMK